MIEALKGDDLRIFNFGPISRRLLVPVIAFVLIADVLSAQNSLEKHLPLDGNIKTDGSAVFLSWLPPG